MNFLRKIADSAEIELKNNLPLSRKLKSIKVTDEVVTRFVHNWFADVDPEFCLKKELDESVKVFLDLLKAEVKYVVPLKQDIFSLGYICYFLERNVGASVNRKWIYYYCLKELMEGVTLGLTINSRLYYHTLIKLRPSLYGYSENFLYEMAYPYILGDSFSKREFIKRLQQQAILYQTKKGYYSFVNIRVRRFFRYILQVDREYLIEANAVALKEATLYYYDYLRRSAD